MLNFPSDPSTPLRTPLAITPKAPSTSARTSRSPSPNSSNFDGELDEAAFMVAPHVEQEVTDEIPDSPEPNAAPLRRYHATFGAQCATASASPSALFREESDDDYRPRVNCCQRIAQRILGMIGIESPIYKYI